jgi:hypothetical protein
MVKITTNSLLCLIAATFYSNASNPKDFIGVTKKQLIKATIYEELKIHPKATLLDLYKNFFQGKFGPGHMIADSNAASDYFKKELQEATEFDSVLWQAVGEEKNYYRVNLSLVRDGKITAQQLIDAFIGSAKTVKPPSLESWQKDWDLILEIIKKMKLNLPNFEKDKLQIAQKLKKGIVIGDHSSIYTSTYHPHYRIVSKYYFEKLSKIASNH